MKMTLRLGLDSARKSLLVIDSPFLVSANSLWDDKKKKFGGFSNYKGLDIALDSSGFVAMKLYGGYRWTHTQYAKLARDLNPTWWAQMDFCCEPEIAGSRFEVESRIERTIDGLISCVAAAREQKISDPMPVLQGYEPSDYIAGPLYDAPLPHLIGVGSICRRHLRGKNGLLAVIDALDRKLPSGVVLHLFGVKGTALQFIVNEFQNREFSADSMAYQSAARWDCYKNKKIKTGDLLAEHAKKWLDANRMPSVQQMKLAI